MNARLWIIILFIFNVAAMPDEKPLKLSARKIKQTLQANGLSVFVDTTQIDQKLSGKDFTYHMFVLALENILSDFNKDLPIRLSAECINKLKFKLINFLWPNQAD